jgi:hypothetical protein
MKFFIFVSFICISFSGSAFAHPLVLERTPSLFDSWEFMDEFGWRTMTISHDTLTISVPPIVVRNGSTRQRDVTKSTIWKAKIAKIVYDSGKASGRIFFQSSTPRRFYYYRFLIYDNGEAIFRGGAEGRNIPYQTLQESLKASTRTKDEDQAGRYVNASRINYFQSLRSVAAITDHDRIEIMTRYTDTTLKIFKRYFDRKKERAEKDLPPEDNNDEMALTKIKDDLFISYGYNPFHREAGLDTIRQSPGVLSALKELTQTRERYAQNAYDEITKIHERKKKEKLAAEGKQPEAKKDDYFGGYEIYIPDYDKNGIEKGNVWDPKITDFIPVETQPVPLTKIEDSIIYPKHFKGKQHGKISFGALVQRNGVVKNMQIIKSENTELNHALTDAVMKTKFTPAIYIGQYSKAWYVSSIMFSR